MLSQLLVLTVGAELMGPVILLMTRKMLLGIKKRAERQMRRPEVERARHCRHIGMRTNRADRRADAPVGAACRAGPAGRRRPSTTYDAIRRIDVIDSLLVGVPNRVRAFPERAVRWARRLPPSRQLDQFRFEQLLDNGFHLLANEPGRELVLGLIGRWWQRDFGRVDWAPADFRDPAGVFAHGRGARLDGVPYDPAQARCALAPGARRGAAHSIGAGRAGCCLAAHERAVRRRRL